MDWRKLCRNLLLPPVWIIIALTVISTAGLAFVFVKGLEQSIAAYIIYVLAFYTLTVLCIFLSLVLPKQYKHIRQKIYNNPLGSRYMTDTEFRTHIWLHISLAINLLYAGVNVLSFILYRSMWFVCLAVYYSILAVMRFLLAKYARRNGFGRDMEGELKRTVICSCILLTLNFALSGSVLMMLYQNKGYEYHGIMIYIMATYTFYITANSIVGLVKSRRQNSPAITMTRVISLSAALVSMLSLETAMFSAFGQDMNRDSKRLMIILTGAGVSLCVITMSLYMIIRSTNEIKSLKGEQNGKQK